MNKHRLLGSHNLGCLFYCRRLEGLDSISNSCYTPRKQLKLLLCTAAERQSVTNRCRVRDGSPLPVAVPSPVIDGTAASEAGGGVSSTSPRQFCSLWTAIPSAPKTSTSTTRPRRPPAGVSACRWRPSPNGWNGGGTKSWTTNPARVSSSAKLTGILRAPPNRPATGCRLPYIPHPGRNHREGGSGGSGSLRSKGGCGDHAHLVPGFQRRSRTM